MTLPRYELSAERTFMIFKFISEGPNGKIVKIIKFSKTNLEGFYNLAFGDKGSSHEYINDLIISNNNDSEKVLSTVVYSVYLFTEKYPGSWIYATGSTNSRTRLYRMGLSRYLEVIEKDFDLYGLRENKWEKFKKKIDYIAFLATRKKE